MGFYSVDQWIGLHHLRLGSQGVNTVKIKDMGGELFVNVTYEYNLFEISFIIMMQENSARLRKKERNVQNINNSSSCYSCKQIPLT